MKRNPAAFMATTARGGKGTTERNGKFVRGPKSGRKGHGRGGKMGRGR